MARDRAPTWLHVRSTHLPVGHLAVVDVAVGERVAKFRDVAVEQRRQIDAVRHDDATVLIYVGVSVRPAAMAGCAMHRCTFHKGSLRDTIRQS